MKVYKLAENIKSNILFCGTEEGVCVVSGGKVLVMFVKLDSEGQQKYVFCTNLQSCL
jgi:hypothetical protein